MDLVIDKPLVTIGLPCYNRPEGLKRALENAIFQTYNNLEIIVSDNCSDEEMNIQGIVASYIQKDRRIKYFRQRKNEGAFFNFKFVLEKATGEYFMWLADDDERHETCIERSLQIIENQGGAFGTYDIKNRYRKTSHVIKVPAILSYMSLQKRLFRFIRIFPSVYIYGLYKRENLGFFLKEKQAFDFMDGHFAMYILVNYGLNVRSTEYPIITLGINEEHYVSKAFIKSADKLFIYTPVIKKCCRILWSSKQLNIFYKILLVSFFSFRMAKQYVTYEHPYRFVAKIMNITLRLPLRFVYRFTRKYLVVNN